MTTIEQHRGPREERPPAPPAPRISGDERFVPASHVLVSDRRVSHPAFRLWCVLHRLWFLHEPPVMELLQELMGTSVEVKEEHDTPAPQGKRRDHPQVWQPATRRSIERWLCELEAAGWLVWVRREEPSRRYHLRTSAQSAGDAAVLRELRALLNAGAATLAEVQALLGATAAAADHATPESHPQLPLLESGAQDAGQATAGSQDATAGSHRAEAHAADATAESHAATRESHRAEAQAAAATAGSHDPITGSYDAHPASHAATLESHRAEARAAATTAGSHDPILLSQDATPGSHGTTPGSLQAQEVPANATPESHAAILPSHATTPGSHDATPGSYDATPESHAAILRSYREVAEGVRTPGKNGLKHEIHQIRDLPTEITPPPPATPASGEGGGGGPTATERYLLRAGFSARAAREFRGLTLAAVQADVARRRELGQGFGAMVTAWRVEPPEAVTEASDPVASAAARATSAKAAALAVAPPDASEIEIQYLALDLEDGASPDVALANLRHRRAGTGGDV